MRRNLLEIKNLRTSFFTQVGEVKALQGVSLNVDEGDTIAIVGESGCGKSVLALSVMGLLHHTGKIIDGDVCFDGESLIGKSEKEMMDIRGKKMTMIFQDPTSALNPVFTIGDQIVEMFMTHQKLSRREARKKAVEILEIVGIASPETRLDAYPHELSGGMRQRVVIAIALSCEPKLLIADEPTTALDVTVQAQILRLMSDMRERIGMSILLITHDLGVVAEFCSTVMVMYGGLILESGPAEIILRHPGHPYTMALLKSVPKLRYDEGDQLVSIMGRPPDLLHPPEGCPFYMRCDYAMRICGTLLPEFHTHKPGHRSRCWRYNKNAPAHKAFTNNTQENYL